MMMTEAPLWELSKESIVQPRRPNELAQADWDQILAVKQMLDDRVHAGARIRITRSPVFPNADHKLLMKEAFVDWLDRVLADAELVDP
jgi:hypothetical protein